MQHAVRHTANQRLIHGGQRSLLVVSAGARAAGRRACAADAESSQC